VSGPRRLSVLPSRREQQVLDWLAESQAARSGDVLELAFAKLPRVPQRRPWPWTRMAERVRPEPFGSQQARLLALAVAAMLLLMLFAATVLTVGHRGFADMPQDPAPLASNLAVAPSAPAISASPATSPAASRVFPLGAGYEFVITGGPGGDRLFTIGSNGAGRTDIGSDITGRSNLVTPQWGRDRSVLVLDQTQVDEQSWLVDPTGVKRSQVIVPCVDPCQTRNEASWSHDGKKIVLYQGLDGPVNGMPITCGLALYDGATLAIDFVTSSPCGIVDDRNPRFSPDDKSIAFWRSRSPGRVAGDQIEDSALFTRNLETGKEFQVTDWTTHATMLDWSPDGRWLVFVPDTWDRSAPAADIWRVHPDGTGLERMTTIDTTDTWLLQPRYTPDGAWIVFTRRTEDTGELLAIPADGGKPIAVLPGTAASEFDVRAR